MYAQMVIAEIKLTKRMNLSQNIVHIILDIMNIATIHATKKICTFQ